MSDSQGVFNHGTTWVRANFHMHTKADTEFEYDGEESRFVSSYVEAMKKAGIGIGVITNHNKFDRDEYRALAKAAKKQEILLLPGVELSVKDGANGIHTLVVFSPDWITNQENKNYIQNFLDVTFAGIANFENENGRSNHDLNDTFRELDKFQRDYFLIFAHVEAGSGLWRELAGGRLGELGKHPPFRKRCLGFQKVRTRDKRSKVQGHLRGFYPAEVEGCDCKSIEEIGKGKECYLKVGAFTFDAVKFALLDHGHRVSSQARTPKHSLIERIEFDGGRLDGTTLDLSPELNAMIGIRGSGKSSILESLRYTLGIELPVNADKDGYKQGAIRNALGSGGKVTVRAIDRHGNKYEIRRILDQKPDVYIDGELQPGINIQETILHKPIYFGQKDLSSKEPGFEKDLVEKLVGPSLDDVRRAISERRVKVEEAIARLGKLSGAAGREQEILAQKQDAEHRLRVFKEHGAEEKLKRQLDYNNDSHFVEKSIAFVTRYLEELDEFTGRHEEEFTELSVYESLHNSKFFDEFLEVFGKLKEGFENMQAQSEAAHAIGSTLNEKAQEFVKLKDALKEEFAEESRKVLDELKDNGASSVEPHDVLKIKKAITHADDELKAARKEKGERAKAEEELLRCLVALNDEYHKEFKLIDDRLQKINDEETALKIEVDYRGDKAAFLSFVKDNFRGSKLREATLQLVVDKFVDGAAIYRDMVTAKMTMGASAEIFGQWFNENLGSFLTWQVPNSYTITYHGKALKSHSLGQRASALILFVLSQRDSDVVLIDQPEDDLDNQTIYEDVIKLIRKLKPETQFIFATHNPNIPVLGDSEQVISCSCDEKIHVSLGSVDCPEQQKAIVTIMEGGSEAFQRRRDIYEVWSERTS